MAQVTIYTFHRFHFCFTKHKSNSLTHISSSILSLIFSKIILFCDSLLEDFHFTTMLQNTVKTYEINQAKMKLRATGDGDDKGLMPYIY